LQIAWHFLEPTPSFSVLLFTGLGIFLETTIQALTPTFIKKDQTAVFGSFCCQEEGASAAVSGKR